jgi:hypothetical protein
MGRSALQGRAQSLRIQVAGRLEGVAIANNRCSTGALELGRHARQSRFQARIISPKNSRFDLVGEDDFPSGMRRSVGAFCLVGSIM